MSDQQYLSLIHNIGFIPAVSSYTRDKKNYEKESSTEDYVGKITAIFAPYISKSITEGRFLKLQEEVKNILTEIRGNKA